MGMGDWMLPGAAFALLVIGCIVMVTLDDIVMSILRPRRGPEQISSVADRLPEKAVRRSWRSKLRQGTKAVIRRPSRMPLPRRRSGHR
jgi:hypothetical protein